MLSEKLVHNGGLAAAAGGLLFVSGILGVFASDGGRAAAAVVVLLVLLTMPLLAAGLIAFYRRLPVNSRPASTISFGVSLSGLLIYNASYARLVLPLLPGRWAELSATIGFAGLYAMLLGIAVMGIMALTSKALGRWSFAPLLLAASGAGWVFGYSILLLLYAIGWILLGIGLWKDPPPAASNDTTAR